MSNSPDFQVLLLVQRMQYIADYIGNIHPSRGCIGCDLCTARALLEGGGEDPVDELISNVYEWDILQKARPIADWPPYDH